METATALHQGSEESGPGVDRSDMPVLVRELLSEAMDVQATDIHVDSIGRRTYRVCFRVDGVIQPRKEISHEEGRHLVNQIKVAAEFTPDRTFVPLENRITLAHMDTQHDVRVTILPTSRHEAAHLRILSAPSEVLGPEELGVSPQSLALLRKTLKRPEGLILISGPTGGGKSMTLYSLASYLDLQSMIAVSVEDPVEFDLPYVRQVQANPEQGLPMSRALKTVFRMDPDIILVGEVRDSDSALTAVRAASSGRFVLATMHATDVFQAVETCQYYSVPRHLLASSLRLILSQALIRRVCRECVGERSLTHEEKALFASEGLKTPSRVPEPRGCEACHGFGYRGRIGVFQVVPFDRAMASAVSGARSLDALRGIMAENETPSLLQDALGKVAEGITTAEEVRNLHVPGSAT